MRRAILILGALIAGPALAQTAPPDGDGALSITLDGRAQEGAACRLTFVAQNGLGADAGPVIEAVAFDTEGGVAAITLFDLGEIPDGRTRVRRFDLPGTDCAGLGAILVNGVEDCGGAEGCAGRLRVASRVEGVEMMR